VTESAPESESEMLAAFRHLLLDCKRYASCRQKDSCRSTWHPSQLPHISQAQAILINDWQFSQPKEQGSPAADRITRFFKWSSTSHPFYSDAAVLLLLLKSI